MLLAALDARRPTRDIDFAAPAIENTIEKILSAVRTIAAISIDDGMEFDSNSATAVTIREDDSYSGIRVMLGGTLSRSVIRFHVDVNVGDPIGPEPQQINVPRLIDGVIVVRGYPLETVLAEKIVTALERGTANTRWRAWLRKQHLDNSIPTDFSIVLERVVAFADPLIVQDGAQGDWHPIQGNWI